MKWNKLADKEPPFGVPLIIWRKAPEGEIWGEGMLEKIETTESGKLIIFNLATEHEGFTVTDATHWTIPTKPKE